MKRRNQHAQPSVKRIKRSCPIDILPPEMLKEIFSFLPHREKFITVTQVCKKWKKVGDEFRAPFITRKGIHAKVLSELHKESLFVAFSNTVVVIWSFEKQRTIRVLYALFEEGKCGGNEIADSIADIQLGDKDVVYVRFKGSNVEFMKIVIHERSLLPEKIEFFDPKKKFFERDMYWKDETDASKAIIYCSKEGEIKYFQIPGTPSSFDIKHFQEEKNLFIIHSLNERKYFIVDEEFKCLDFPITQHVSLDSISASLIKDDWVIALHYPNQVQVYHLSKLNENCKTILVNTSSGELFRENLLLWNEKGLNIYKIGNEISLEKIISFSGNPKIQPKAKLTLFKCFNDTLISLVFENGYHLILDATKFKIIADLQMEKDERVAEISNHIVSSNTNHYRRFWNILTNKHYTVQNTVDSFTNIEIINPEMFAMFGKETSKKISVFNIRPNRLELHSTYFLKDVILGMKVISKKGTTLISAWDKLGNIYIINLDQRLIIKEIKGNFRNTNNRNRVFPSKDGNYIYVQFDSSDSSNEIIRFDLKNFESKLVSNEEAKSIIENDQVFIIINDEGFSVYDKKSTKHLFSKNVYQPNIYLLPNQNEFTYSFMDEEDEVLNIKKITIFGNEILNFINGIFLQISNSGKEIIIIQEEEEESHINFLNIENAQITKRITINRTLNIDFLKIFQLTNKAKDELLLITDMDSMEVLNITKSETTSFEIDSNFSYDEFLIGSDCIITLRMQDSTCIIQKWNLETGQSIMCDKASTILRIVDCKYFKELDCVVCLDSYGFLAACNCKTKLRFGIPLLKSMQRSKQL